MSCDIEYIANSNKLISIIIPSYNGSRYIRYAIDSIINQTYQNWELILVDDYSADNTKDIMSEYELKFQNIRIVCNKKNLGIADSLNRGFAEAKGSFYTWISDDNIFKSDALKVMIDKLLSYYSEVDIVYANYHAIGENGEIFSKERTVGNANSLIWKYSIGPCFLFKSECYVKSVGYEKGRRMCEDLEFFLRLYNLEFKFKNINKSLFYFRKHNAAMGANIYKMTIATEEILLRNVEDNRNLIKNKKDIAKVYLQCFLKNKFNLKLNLLFTSFLVNPIYTLSRMPSVISRISKYFTKTN